MTARKTRLTNYWLSYSDLMAGLLFVLFAIIVIANFQNQQKVETLEEIKVTIDEYIELRSIIRTELAKRFDERKINSAIVDSLGNIEFLDTDDVVWFKKDSTRLLPKAQNILDEVMPTYFEVLFDTSITRNMLDRILIEGHASLEHDEWNRYLKDLDLSQGRAFSVGAYVIKNNLSHYFDLKNHLVALGRSFADAKHPGVGNVERWRDRTVVFRYTLKYEEMMRELETMAPSYGN